MSRTIAIGDIHGCAKTLISLLEKLNIDQEDTIIFLGDYIDRGPNSAGVIHTILALQQRNYRLRTLRGNHEQMFLDSEDGFTQFQHFVQYGGDRTLESFDVDFLNELPTEYQKFFEKTELYYQSDDYIFVHAGLNFNNADLLQDTEAMLWIRGFADHQPSLQNKLMIHGHTPKPLDYILAQKGNCINLDGGCVYAGEEKGYGYLVAFICETREFVWVENCEEEIK
jgi:serine/threonine protein phosphatase 1